MLLSALSEVKLAPGTCLHTEGEHLPGTADHEYIIYQRFCPPLDFSTGLQGPVPAGNRNVCFSASVYVVLLKGCQIFSVYCPSVIFTVTDFTHFTLVGLFIYLFFTGFVNFVYCCCYE